MKHWGNNTIAEKSYSIFVFDLFIKQKISPPQDFQGYFNLTGEIIIKLQNVCCYLKWYNMGLGYVLNLVKKRIIS
jgi:hypothetical protein